MSHVSASLKKDGDKQKILHKAYNIANSVLIEFVFIKFRWYSNTTV